MARKKTMGRLMMDLEVLLDAMIDNHEMQVGDIMNLVHGHLVAHRPDAFEQYIDDGSAPTFYYGPKKHNE